MDQSVESETPSPNPSTPPTGATSRSQFSIDYILSASASKQINLQQANENQSKTIDQMMTLMNNPLTHQPIISSQPTNRAQSNQQSQEHTMLHQQQQQQMKITQPLPQQSPPQPHFLYFMCMLLQQQQQQQQQIARQQLASANQHAAARRPVDSARGPMDSLAILASLTGAQGVVGLQQQMSNGILGKQSSRSNLHNQPIRHQPYPPHRDGRAGPPFATMHPNSAVNPLFNGSGLSNLQMLSQQRHRSPPLLVQNDIKQQSSRYLTTNTTGSCHLSAPSMIPPSNINQRQISPTSAPAQSQCASGQSHSLNGDKLDNLKPAHSYIGLIGMCILSTPEKKMVLNDIYQFILDHYPYYRNRGSGWRNSVRHNLSLNECFQKSGRAANGKGHYWTIHPANMEDFMLGDFRRRRAQRKVRRWNNMDVPSDESDDESLEDVNKPPLPEHFKRSLEMHRQLEVGYRKSVEALVARQISGEQSANAAAAAAVVAIAMNDPSKGPSSIQI